jgi:tight adherence protein B
MSVVAVGALLAAAWVVAHPRVRPARPHPPRAVPRLPRAALVLAVPVALVVAVVLLPAPGVTLAVLLAVVTAVAERRRSRAQAQRRRTRDEVDECLVLLRAELGAGRSPPQALAAAAPAAPGLLEQAAAVAALAGDPQPALRGASAHPGAAALADLAAAWQVAVGGGAPLSALLERMRLSVAAETAAAREAEEQVAPVRATARVLAVLPALGLLLGGAVGVNSMALLTGTLWGQVCLLLAVTLVAAGLAWVAALVRSAVDEP